MPISETNVGCWAYKTALGAREKNGLRYHVVIIDLSMVRPNAPYAVEVYRIKGDEFNGTVEFVDGSWDIDMIMLFKDGHIDVMEFVDRGVYFLKNIIKGR